ncbi:hypothetical protein [Phaeobacter inhibens]|uniref:hypothetical protein n=1 Tax=Phaeobacter inhibens TaxID=221822 RepID=UPI00295E5664|nr:hypothetical protein [Phaeobacter inhibens]
MWELNTDETPATDEMVQVLCEQLHDAPDAVSIGDHGAGEEFVSIGYIRADNMQWEVAGWNMHYDCWASAAGCEVIGWRPLANPKDP